MKKWIGEWQKNKINILLVFVIACLAYYISHNWFQLMLIQGESMEPSYNNMQLVILDRRVPVIEPGDVVAFRSELKNAVLVKRVIAGPEDSICIDEGFVYVNGLLSENIRDNVYIEYSGIAESAIWLQEGEYFVLGDNYAYSVDSRYEEIGIIKEDNIIGVVIPQIKVNYEQK